MSAAGLSPTGSGADGQAAGAQAQFNLLLQLMQKIVAALNGTTTSNDAFVVYPITAAGDVNIATAYPAVRSGIFSVRKTVPATTTITLPTYGGPWGVADGANTAGIYPITVTPPGGYTIGGAGMPPFQLNANGQYATFVLDDTNFLVGL